MKSAKYALVAIALSLVARTLGAQVSRVQIVDTDPATFGFIDLTAFPGITGVQDDTAHAFTSTVSNVLWTPGPLLIGNNGAVVGGVNTGEISNINVAVPSVGPPAHLPPGGGTYVMPFWTDLLQKANFAPSDTTIFAAEITIGTQTVLVIEWVNETHFAIENDNQTITFEVQVFDSPSLCQAPIQLLYADTFFGTGNTQFGTPLTHFNEGGDATIGVASQLGNAQWSFRQHSVAAGTVLSVRANLLVLTAVSPQGPGSLFLSCFPIFCGGDSHFLAITTQGSIFSGGFLFGLDMPITQILDELAFGPPFTGPGSFFTVGPIVGLPNITIFAAAVHFKQGVLFGGSAPIQYTIP